MSKRKIVETIEKRAFRARKTMKQVCNQANVHPTTFSRWKRNPESMTPTSLEKIEGALDFFEKKAAS